MVRGAAGAQGIVVESLMLSGEVTNICLVPMESARSRRSSFSNSVTGASAVSGMACEWVSGGWVSGGWVSRAAGGMAPLATSVVSKASVSRVMRVRPLEELTRAGVAGSSSQAGSGSR